MARKSKVNAAYSLITGEPKQETKALPKEGANPVGVLLYKHELEQLKEIANELGFTRHQVIQYAVRDFLKRYDQGEKPRVETKTIKELKP